MSLDRSLKIKGALKRHRNVLSRAERIQKLQDEERWNEDDSLFGLPKVAHRKTHAGRKEAKATAEAETEAVPTTEPESEAAEDKSKET